MSVGKNRLSRGARLLYQLGIPLVISVVVIASPRTAAALPFIALPTLLLLWKLLQLPNFHRPDLETLIWTYFLSGTLGVVLVVTAQSIGGYTLALMLFGSSTDEYLQEFGRTTLDDVSIEQRQRRAELAWTWKNLIILLFLTFILAGLLEEAMKYLAVNYIRRRYGKLKTFDYIAYAIASAVGYSTIENIGFVYASAQVDSVRMTVLTVTERIIIAMPGHALMGVLTALNMIERDLKGLQLTTWRILYPSVLYHGCFDLAMFGVSAMYGNVGWIHPTEPSRMLLLLVLAASMLATLAWHVTRLIAKVYFS